MKTSPPFSDGPTEPLSVVHRISDSEAPTPSTPATTTSDMTTAHLTLASTTRTGASTRSRTPSLTLIQPAPIIAVLATWKADLESLRRRTPHSDGVAVLASVCEELDRALRAASATHTYMSVEEVSNLSGKSMATVKRICRDQGERAGAAKVRGSWTINWPIFEAYLRTGDAGTDTITNTQTNKEAA